MLFKLSPKPMSINSINAYYNPSAPRFQQITKANPTTPKEKPRRVRRRNELFKTNAETHAVQEKSPHRRRKKNQKTRNRPKKKTPNAQNPGNQTQIHDSKNTELQTHQENPEFESEREKRMGLQGSGVGRKYNSQVCFVSKRKFLGLPKKLCRLAENSLF